MLKRKDKCKWGHDTSDDSSVNTNNACKVCVKTDSKRYWSSGKGKVNNHNKYLKWKDSDKAKAYNERRMKKYNNLSVLVYRWISPDGYTAYVGRGPITRVLAHKNKCRSPWWEPNMFYRTLRARNEWHAMKLEGLWGELFRPRYNKEGYRW